MLRHAALLLLAALPTAATAAERTPYRVERAVSQVAVDGRLDEPAWQRATVVELRYETRPAENAPPPVHTECLLTYDDGGLYVGFRAHDPDPAAIRAHLSDRDDAFDDDFVGIVLDPFNDERRAFELFVNPFGVQMDLFMDDVAGEEDTSWDALWSSAGRITETGYTVEMAIPWSSLRFPRTAGDQTWGFDALRFYPRSQRHRISSHPLDRNVSCYLCQASKMTGFAGITPGRNVELVPTVTATRTDAAAGGSGLAAGDVESEPGLTARWGITPNLTLGAAVNPDFSQIEADAAQLDVNTQFALFFPEKRPFFLEGADFFSTPLRAVFTRNVADPSWGVKLTGKEGLHAVGVFAAQDETTNVLFPGAEGSQSATLPIETTDAVLRYRRDLGGSSALGALLTSRAGDGYANHVAGLDGLYRAGDSDTFRLQLLGSRTEYPESVSRAFAQPFGAVEDHALWASWDHNSRNWRGWARYEDLGADFRADMGFVTRVDYRFLVGGYERVWYPGDRFTRMSLGGDIDTTQDQSGRLLERELEVFFTLFGPRQSYFEPSVLRRRRVYRGVDYDETSFGTFFEIQPTGDLYLRLQSRIGDEIDFEHGRAGDLVSVTPTVHYKLGVRARVHLAHTYERLDVEGGRLYQAGLSQLTLIYQWNIRTFVRAILQHTGLEQDPALYAAEVDPRSEQLFTQLLFSYKLNPQTVLFAGYSDNAQGVQESDLTRTHRTFFFKVGYAWVP